MSKKEKKNNKDSRIDVRMTEKDIAWLNILTIATGKSRSDIIRELIAKEAIKILVGEK